MADAWFIHWPVRPVCGLYGPFTNRSLVMQQCLPECLPDEATPVTGWFDLRSLLDYGPKTNSSLYHILCRQFLNAFTDVTHIPPIYNTVREKMMS